MSTSYEKRLLRVVEYIHDNPTGDLSLDALADVAAMSRFHWHRVFHAMTGETCAEAVRRVRLHKAAFLLVQTDTPIDRVARDTGHSGLQAFGRVFKKSYGLSPASFRNRGALVAPLTHAKRGDYPVYPIDVETFPARRLAAVPHKGAYNEVGKAFELVSGIFTARELWGHARGMIGVYYDDPTAVAEEDLQSHAGVVVGDGAPITEPLTEVALPEGRYAVMHYKGPYAGLHAAYQHLYGTWLPDSGEEAGDHPPIEVYLNGPAETALDELLTDVCIPLK
ncbi:MAG: AraC family transcriptional regulator [Rhodobacteraceae bacterium]|nr:AraC family transcriptional regulator [Paracoccaceae bacterium]